MTEMKENMRAEIATYYKELQESIPTLIAMFRQLAASHPNQEIQTASDRAVFELTKEQTLQRSEPLSQLQALSIALEFQTIFIRAKSNEKIFDVETQGWIMYYLSIFPLIKAVK